MEKTESAATGLKVNQKKKRILYTVFVSSCILLLIVLAMLLQKKAFQPKPAPSDMLTYAEYDAFTFQYPKELTYLPRGGESEEELEESCPALEDIKRTYWIGFCGPYTQTFDKVIAGELEYSVMGEPQQQEVTINGHRAIMFTDVAKEQSEIIVYIDNVKVVPFPNEKEMEEEKMRDKIDSLKKYGMYTREIEEQMEEEEKEKERKMEEGIYGTLEVSFLPGKTINKQEYQTAKNTFFSIIQSLQFIK